MPGEWGGVDLVADGAVEMEMEAAVEEEEEEGRPIGPCRREDQGIGLGGGAALEGVRRDRKRERKYAAQRLSSLFTCLLFSTLMTTHDTFTLYIVPPSMFIGLRMNGSSMYIVLV